MNSRCVNVILGSAERVCFKLIDMKNTAIKYIHGLSDNKLSSALDYLRYLYEQEQDYPLDDFDYELSKRADEAADTETISFEDVLHKSGLTFENIQN